MSKGEEEKERLELLKIRSYSEQTFDKQLVYLAGGGLVLTIGFVKEVVDLKSANYINFLFLTWILFTISLTLNLISHKSSTKSIDARIDSKERLEKVYNFFTQFLNVASILSLIGGVSCFVFFVIKNISNG